MVLVERQAVEAHFLGVNLFIQVPVVELSAHGGVIEGVADAQVGTLGSHQS